MRVCTSATWPDSIRAAYARTDFTVTANRRCALAVRAGFGGRPMDGYSVCREAA
ncbi:MAG: hypothetical protein QOK04_1109 [Solirubrobacteraceae bacterium]|jgi:hypothetical protein|nr:hypothetical protein [Solirubrobacteraceae bacterium]